MSPRPWPPLSEQEYRRAARAALGDPALGDLFAQVQAIILDADGVLTPGNLLYGPQGEALKEFDSQDGLGLVMARAVGLKLAVLTGRRSEIVARRAADLRFDAIRLGRFDKGAALAEILAELDCPPARALYMGDDLIDLPALDAVGLPVAVPAAPPEVRDRCRYVTKAAGGRGAVREATDLALKCRGRFAEALRRVAAGDAPPASPRDAGERT